MRYRITKAGAKWRLLSSAKGKCHNCGKPLRKVESPAWVPELQVEVCDVACAMWEWKLEAGRQKERADKAEEALKKVEEYLVGQCQESVCVELHDNLA